MSEPTNELDLRLVSAALSGMLDRLDYASKVRESHDGRRDYYRVTGYPTDITFDQYWQRYRRQSLANRVIDLPVEATWSGGRVQVAGFPEWESFEGRLDVTARLTELDRLAGIGQYAVMLIGIAEDESVTADPTKVLERPVEKLTSLDQIVFLRQYPQNRAEISEVEKNPSSPDFGKPKFYKLDLDAIASSRLTTTVGRSQEVKVHASRIIHVPSRAILNDFIGIPRLECIYDHLIDMDKVIGGGAEMWWQGADRLLHFAGQGRIDAQTQTEVSEQLEKIMHGLRRYLLTSSAELKTLQSVTPDPSAFYEVLTGLIAAGSGIPVRILMGSERGELASTQDRDNFADNIARRRQSYAEPRILNALLSRLNQWGVGTALEDLDAIWPPIQVLNTIEKAELALKRVEAIAKAEQAAVLGSVVDENELRQVIGFAERGATGEPELLDETDPNVTAQFQVVKDAARRRAA